MKHFVFAVFWGLGLIRISIPLALAIEGHCVANCGDGSSSSTPSASSGNSYGSPPAPYRDPDLERKLELERIRSREAEKVRRQAEAMIRAQAAEASQRALELAAQRKGDWQKHKDEALRSLKSPVPRRLQEDYHKTLVVNKVPSPVLKKAPAPASRVVSPIRLEETELFKRWKEFHPLLKHADLVLEGMRQGALQAGEKMKELSREEATEQFYERFPLARKVSDFFEKHTGWYQAYYQEVKDLYEKIGGAHKETATGLFEHMREGVRELASPTVGGSTEEKMEEWTKSRGEAYEKMAHEKIGEKTGVKDLLEKTLEGEEEEGVTEGDGNMVPIEGLKSYARQRQEALNQQR